MTAAGAPLDPAQLERVLERVDSSVRLVPVRFLRRVIRRHYGLASNQRPPHDLCFDVARDELLAIVSNSELSQFGTLPERVLLLPLPADDSLTDTEVLVDLWRRLFHAKVDLAIEQKGTNLNPIGATLLHEIRTVLDEGHRLSDCPSDADVMREFAALLLEVHYFHTVRIESYFPGLPHAHDVIRRLDEQLGAKAIFDAARLPGVTHSAATSEQEQIEPLCSAAIIDDPASISRAQRAVQAGNDVRAAILYRKLNDIPRADECLRHLTERLKDPLHLDDAAAEQWHEALRPLLEPATHGFWTVSDRLLYQLQKACLDVEHKVYAIDLVEMIVTIGKQPLKRLLDKPREVKILRRLRTALSISQRAKVTAEQRRHLEELLLREIEKGEQRVRAEDRPLLRQVFDEVGLVPTNQAEQVARDKVVEELLDVLCSRGFLTMSDLRDAIARNRLKMNDLAGPFELIGGDPLIRANRILALRLDGVYRRGEIYLRTLQRGSSVAFGTVMGRLLMTFAILPFGGSYVLLEGARHFLKAMFGLGRFAAARIDRHFLGNLEQRPILRHHHEFGWLTTPEAIILVGVFLLAMIQVPWFRRRVSGCAYWLLIKLPLGIFYSPQVQIVFGNVVTRFVLSYLLTPLICGSAVFVLTRILHFSWDSAFAAAGCAVLLTGVLFRTPWGEGLEERLDETLAHVWRIVSVNFVIGLITWVLHFFGAIVEAIERGIYAVDEWLRFHEGQGSFSFVFKLIFGTIWFFIAYLFKFAWNLLVEPQINPIKHFPVVTVSHKLLLPMVPSVASAFHTSIATVTTVFVGIPGIFGFLVWEFKENWKLYRANASSAIGPAAVGLHGERIRSLLRPGVHSGGVPKTFAKWRRAQRRGRPTRAAKLHHHLEEIAEAIHHLAQRQLIAYLRISKRWDNLPTRTSSVRLATNRIRIHLSIDHWQSEVVVSLEQRGSFLIGSIEERGWLDKLNEKQFAAFRDAVTGFYKLAGVDVLREQAAAILDIDPAWLDGGDDGLLVLRPGEPEPIVIDEDEPRMAELLFSQRSLAWSVWVERWEQDHADKSPLGELLGST